MAGHFKFLSFVVALGVSASAFAATITEHFDTDPSSRGWGGVNSNASNGATDPDGAGPQIANDYGWKATDDTGTAVAPPGGTASGAGEIGGVFTRAPNMFYGVSLGGPVDFNTTNMNVKGVLRQMNAESSSTLNLGWSRGFATVNSPLGIGPTSALYVSWDDGNNGAAPGMASRRSTVDPATGSTANPGTKAVPNLVEGDPAQPFEFDWNATTKTFSFTLGSTTNTLVLTSDQVAAMGPLDHWGVWGRTNNDGVQGGAGAHDEGNQLRLDDITYTAVPEPASLGLLSLGALGLLRRRRHS